MDDQESIAREIRRLAETDEEEPDFFGPVSEETVAAAERELGFAFPRTYRIFLRHFGAAYMLGYEFEGLPDPPPAGRIPRYCHVVDSTKEDWKNTNGHGMPTYLICVTDDGGDYDFYFDTRKSNERGEYPVVVYGPGAVGIVVAEDFLDFVRKLANDDPLF